MKLAPWSELASLFLSAATSIAYSAKQTQQNEPRDTQIGYRGRHLSSPERKGKTGGVGVWDVTSQENETYLRKADRDGCPAGASCAIEKVLALSLQRIEIRTLSCCADVTG